MRYFAEIAYLLVFGDVSEICPNINSQWCNASLRHARVFLNDLPFEGYNKTLHPQSSFTIFDETRDVAKYDTPCMM
jgi:hypothetical protein